MLSNSLRVDTSEASGDSAEDKTSFTLVDGPTGGRTIRESSTNGDHKIIIARTDTRENTGGSRRYLVRLDRKLAADGVVPSTTASAQLVVVMPNLLASEHDRDALAAELVAALCAFTLHPETSEEAVAHSTFGKRVGENTVIRRVVRNEL